METLNYFYCLILMLNDLYLKVSKEMDIPVEVVEEAYKSYWKFIRHTIQELPLKDNLTEEEFAKFRTNFNIVSLGKLSCTYDRMLNMKKRLEYIKNIREKKND